MSAPTNRSLTVVALLLAMFMAAMEGTVVSTAMPTVIAQLGGALHYAWVFAAYMLTTTVMVPIYGKLSDLYGRKPVILVAMAFFLAGSIASGQAHTMSALIVFRAIQGIGAGGLQPIALTIIGDIFDLEERAKMQGLFGSVWAIAGLVGPLLGGVIVANVSWRWVFYVNVPFGLLSAALLAAGLRESIEKKDHELDILGAALSSTAVIMVLLGIDGLAPHILFPGSLAAFVAFILVERRAPEPLLPLALFRQRSLATTNVMQAAAGGGMVGLSTFLPLYLQGIVGSTPTQAGGVLAVIAITWPIASATSGRLVARVGFRALVRVGMGLVACSAVGSVVAMQHDAGPGLLRVTCGFFGIGMGLANAALVIAAQTSVPFSQRGVVTASTMFFRNIGGTIAIGVMGSVLARGLVAGSGRTAAEAATLVARLLGPERRDLPAGMLGGDIATDLAHGLSRVGWLIVLLGLVAAGASWLYPDVPHKAKT